jgi:hypothetical protein
MDAPPAGDFCHLMLSANFSLRPLTAKGTKRSVSLENIAWIPGAAKAQGQAPAGGGSTAASPSSPTSPQ